MPFRAKVDILVQYVYNRPLKGLFKFQKYVFTSPISLANLSKIFVNDTFCKQLTIMAPEHKHFFRTTLIHKPSLKE